MKRLLLSAIIVSFAHLGYAADTGETNAVTYAQSHPINCTTVPKVAGEPHPAASEKGTDSYTLTYERVCENGGSSLPSPPATSHAKN